MLDPQHTSRSRIEQCLRHSVCDFDPGWRPCVGCWAASTSAQSADSKPNVRFGHVKDFIIGVCRHSACLIACIRRAFRRSAMCNVGRARRHSMESRAEPSTRVPQSTPDGSAPRPRSSELQRLRSPLDPADLDVPASPVAPRLCPWLAKLRGRDPAALDPLHLPPHIYGPTPVCKSMPI